MQTANQMKSHLSNLRFYSEKIAELAKEQYESDYQRGTELGFSPDPGTDRLKALGCIIAGTNWLDIYCDNIEKNIEWAERQDKLLHAEGESNGL